MKLGTASQAKVATFPSGAMTLDIALGGGLGPVVYSHHHN